MSIIIPILLMGKLRFRDLKHLSQGHSAKSWTNNNALAFYPLTALHPNNRMCMSSEISVFPSFPCWPCQMQAMALAAPLHTMWPAHRKSSKRASLTTTMRPSDLCCCGQGVKMSNGLAAALRNPSPHSHGSHASHCLLPAPSGPQQVKQAIPGRQGTPLTGSPVA